MVDNKRYSEGDSGLLITVYEGQYCRQSKIKCAFIDIFGHIWPYSFCSYAAIPIGLNGNWVIMLITATGNVLAVATGSLSKM